MKESTYKNYDDLPLFLRLKGMTCENVCVDLLEDKCVQEVIEEQPYNKEAYIIFTSGTTGIPKGVLLVIS